MNKKYTSIVAFTFMQGLKSNWFISLLLIGIVLIALALNYPKIIDLFMESDPQQVYVVDLTDNTYFLDQFENGIDSPSGSITYEMCGIENIETIKEEIISGNNDSVALIVFDKTVPYATIYYGDKIDTSVLSSDVVPFAHSLSQLYTASLFGLSSEEIQSLFLEENVFVEYIAEDASAAGYFLLIIFLMALYILIMIYGGILANAVVEEKSSRIMENILCYCKPLTHMFGKITGYFLLAIVHMALWFMSGMILLHFFPLENVSTELMTGLFTFRTVILFIISLMFGFLMYASAYVAFASFADNSQDSTQLMIPMTVILVITFFASILTLRHIGSGISTVLSYCPFIAPVQFFGEAVYRNVSVANICLHFIIQAIEVFAIAWIAARFYKMGVFKYGGGGILAKFKQKAVIEER